tara:strand:- start:1968 stop:2534 length:567 start_codon:yes stop_codon:yes gene_type:complete
MDRVNRKNKFQLKLLAPTIALIGAMLSAGTQASVIFTWGCDNPGLCSPGNGQVFEGSITFSDAGYSPGGSFVNTSGSLVEEFAFTSTIVGSSNAGGSWSLGNLAGSINLLEWSFNAAGTEISRLFHPVAFVSNTWEFNTGQFLDVGATNVNDFGNFSADGAWTKVPSPATLSLLALGLLGLGAARRRA